MSAVVLVVDFGTTTSSAVVVSGDDEWVVREPGSDRDWWPSAVCLDGDELLVGSPAEQLRRSEPQAFRSEFKRELGAREPLLLGDKAFPAKDLVAELLEAVRDEAVDLAGGPVDRAVLTVPASYRPREQRFREMIEVGERLGFAEVELLPEPVAAAYAPLRGDPLPAGSTLLVYDFGGGTFDAAVLEVAADGRHRVLGHRALDDCGGRDVDALVGDWVREQGGDRLTAALSDGDAADYVRAEVAELVRRVKHHLSDANQVRERLPVTAARVTLERSELSALVAPLVEQTLACCVELLGEHGLTPDAVLLVGGTCRMPVVRDAVAARFGVPLRLATDVSTAVVNGAAAWAGSSGDRGDYPQPPEGGETPLRWEIPGGTATLIRWSVEPGAGFAAGDVLGVTRLPDGTLWRLRADEAGTLGRVHAGSGDLVAAGDWLATRSSSRPPPAASGSAGEAPSAREWRGSRPAFCPDGEWLVSAVGTDVVVQEVMSGREVHRFAHGNVVHSIEPDPFRSRLVTVTSDSVRLFDLNSGELVNSFCENRFTRTGSGMRRAYPTPDADRFIVRDGVGTTTIWDVSRGRVASWPRQGSPFASGRPVDVDLFGFRLVNGHSSGRIEVRHLPTGDPLLDIDSTLGALRAVVLSPDGRRVAAAGGRRAGVWDCVTGERQFDMEIGPANPPEGWPTLVEFHPDGRSLVTTHPYDTIRIWDSADGRLLVDMSIKVARTRGLRVSPNGRWLAVDDVDTGRCRLVAYPDV